MAYRDFWLQQLYCWILFMKNQILQTHIFMLGLFWCYKTNKESNWMLHKWIFLCVAQKDETFRLWKNHSLEETQFVNILFSSFLNIFPVGDFGIELTITTFLTFLYGATYSNRKQKHYINSSISTCRKHVLFPICQNPLLSQTLTWAAT